MKYSARKTTEGPSRKRKLSSQQERPTPTPQYPRLYYLHTWLHLQGFDVPQEWRHLPVLEQAAQLRAVLEDPSTYERFGVPQYKPHHGIDQRIHAVVGFTPGASPSRIGSATIALAMFTIDHGFPRPLPYPPSARNWEQFAAWFDTHYTDTNLGQARVPDVFCYRAPGNHTRALKWAMSAHPVISPPVHGPPPRAWEADGGTVWVEEQGHE